MLTNKIANTTVPHVMQCFFESDSFEDAIRNAISIGGDSEILAAITGAVAQGFYGIDDDILKEIRRTMRILEY